MSMLKLMIVDDSNIIRRKIERGCNSSQFEVVGLARNGAEAVQMAFDTKPDVVTMDLTMPEIDGINCIERLLEIDEELLILVVSAISDKATGIEALEKGARGFLYKPFSDNSLVEALNELTE